MIPGKKKKEEKTEGNTSIPHSLLSLTSVVIDLNVVHIFIL